MQHGRPLYWLGNTLKPLCFRTASRVVENRFVVPQTPTLSAGLFSIAGCGRLAARASVLIQALLKKRDAITTEYLRFVRLVRATELFELFRASLFCDGAILRGDLVGVDGLLGNSGLTE